MNWLNPLWWFLYAIAAIAMQSWLPGLDFLLPGFLIALQEMQTIQTLCIGMLFVVLQEGMGNLAFGGVMLLFVFAVVLFYSGCRLFQGRNFLFIMLLGIVLAILRYMIFTVFCHLQDFPVNTEALWDECFFQAFFTPFVWWGASSLRRVVKHEA